ncbi:MAG: hypothetical protein K6G83_05505, partial [Lachnospiraceae bacterium]|nr:hypothetical protein [Lachnospiraceae bacterium]
KLSMTGRVSVQEPKGSEQIRMMVTVPNSPKHLLLRAYQNVGFAMRPVLLRSKTINDGPRICSGTKLRRFSKKIVRLGMNFSSCRSGQYADRIISLGF